MKSCFPSKSALHIQVSVNKYVVKRFQVVIPSKCIYLTTRLYRAQVPIVTRGSFTRIHRLRVGMTGSTQRSLLDDMTDDLKPEVKSKGRICITAQEIKLDYEAYAENINRCFLFTSGNFIEAVRDATGTSVL